MYDIFIVFVCFYFAYSNITTLAEVPIAQWEWVQWLLLLVTLALIAVGILRGITFFKNEKKKRSENKKEAPAPRRSLLDDEDDAGAFEDDDEYEIDAEDSTDTADFDMLENLDVQATEIPADNLPAVEDKNGDSALDNKPE